ncbi:hypothetical protein EDD15DRAFT_2196100 [Pisolithus albus]|nr:hypothetical protein EDD15DRAFT_2196100 [Pisolithus albus]
MARLHAPLCLSLPHLAAGISICATLRALTQQAVQVRSLDRVRVFPPIGLDDNTYAASQPTRWTTEKSMAHQATQGSSGRSQILSLSVDHPVNARRDSSVIPVVISSRLASTTMSPRDWHATKFVQIREFTCPLLEKLDRNRKHSSPSKFGFAIVRADDLQCKPHGNLKANVLYTAQPGNFVWISKIKGRAVSALRTSVRSSRYPIIELSLDGLGDLPGTTGRHITYAHGHMHESVLFQGGVR